MKLEPPPNAHALAEPELRVPVCAVVKLLALVACVVAWKIQIDLLRIIETFYIAHWTR